MDNKNSGKNTLRLDNIPTPEFLLGLFSAFENRFQAIADKFFEEISWKQFFAIVCISMCMEPPTINELSDIMGSSHQNIKQILLKLEKKGFVSMKIDDRDKRKQRIYLTEKTFEFNDAHQEGSNILIKKLFEGVSNEQLFTTIETISTLENNLKGF